MDVRDIQQSIFLNSNGTQKIENDAQGRAIYIGVASPGKAVDKAGWQIKKLTYDANSAVTDVQFADGSADFDKIWNDRATYTYS